MFMDEEGHPIGNRTRLGISKCLVRWILSPSAKKLLWATTTPGRCDTRSVKGDGTRLQMAQAKLLGKRSFGRSAAKCQVFDNA